RVAGSARYRRRRAGAVRTTRTTRTPRAPGRGARAAARARTADPRHVLRTGDDAGRNRARDWRRRIARVAAAHPGCLAAPVAPAGMAGQGGGLLTCRAY